MNKKTQVYSRIAFCRMRVKNQTKTRAEKILWGLLVFFSGSLFKVKVFSHLTHNPTQFPVRIVSHLLSSLPLSYLLSTWPCPYSFPSSVSFSRLSFAPRCLTPGRASLPGVSYHTEFPTRCLAAAPENVIMLKLVLLNLKIFDYKFFICWKVFNRVYNSFYNIYINR